MSVVHQVRPNTSTTGGTPRKTNVLSVIQVGATALRKRGLTRRG